MQQDHRFPERKRQPDLRHSCRGESPHLHPNKKLFGRHDDLMHNPAFFHIDIPLDNLFVLNLTMSLEDP